MIQDNELRNAIAYLGGISALLSRIEGMLYWVLIFLFAIFVSVTWPGWHGLLFS